MSTLNYIDKMENLDINLLIAMAFGVFAVLFLLKAVFSLSEDFVNYGSHKKRLKQLKFKEKHDFDSQDLIEGVTGIVEKHVFRGEKPQGLRKIEKDLIMAGWDKAFTPLQYKAVSVALKIIGSIIIVALIGVSKLLAIFIGLIVMFAMEVLLKNDISNKKAQILSHFPELISIVQGYLEASIPLIEALSYAIPFSGDGWKSLLEKLVLDAEINNIEYALDELKNRVDLLEVREFASLIKLAYVQGSNVIESFEAQAKRMEAIKYEVLQMKLQRRRSMGVVVQMPMLLMVFFAFGLPLYPQLTGMLSGGM